MQDQLPARPRPPSGGFVTLGTLILAAVATAAIVAMSACHALPALPGSDLVDGAVVPI